VRIHMGRHAVGWEIIWHPTWSCALSLWTRPSAIAACASCSVLQCGAVWCSVVQFVVVCCSVLQCGSIQTLISITTCIFGPSNRGALQHTNNRGTLQHTATSGTLQHTATSVDTCSCALSLLTLSSPTAACMCCSMAVWCSVVHCLEMWCTVVQCGAVWCCMLQCAPIDTLISINRVAHLY